MWAKLGICGIGFPKKAASMTKKGDGKNTLLQRRNGGLDFKETDKMRK